MNKSFSLSTDIILDEKKLSDKINKQLKGEICKELDKRYGVHHYSANYSARIVAEIEVTELCIP